MIGGICGDIAGSRFEGSTMNPKDFDVFHRDCEFTDDTVCLVAVMDSINQGIPITESLRKWCSNYKGRGYGGTFNRWVRDESMGSYNSYGNGAGMRIAPVSMYSMTEDDLHLKVREYTSVTHNHPEGIKGASAIALGCWLALQGKSKRYIRSEIEITLGYDLSTSLEELYKMDVYEESCMVTVPIALCCALQSNSYEETIRNSIAIGGDSDTIACMSGALAECLYGFPQELFDETLRFLPNEMIDVLTLFYSEAVSSPKPHINNPRTTPEQNNPLKWSNLLRFLKR